MARQILPLLLTSLLQLLQLFNQTKLCYSDEQLSLLIVLPLLSTGPF